MVVIKVLLHCCVADKWHSVCEKMCILFKILIVQLFARHKKNGQWSTGLGHDSKVTYEQV